MTFKLWSIMLIILFIVLLLAFGFQFRWNVEPLAAETLPYVTPTMADPNPPEPVTACAAYGFRQSMFSVDIVLKKVCHTNYIIQ